MRTSFFSLAAVFIPLVGCEKPAIHALEDRIDSLEGPSTGADKDDVAALTERVEELETALATALEEINALQEARSELETDVDTLEANQVTSDDLSSYATVTDVADNTSAISALDERVVAIEADYLTSTDLAGYATEDWVSSQGYASATDVAAIEADYLTSTDLAGYATEDWVEGQDYASAGDLASTEADVADAQDEIDALSAQIDAFEDDYVTLDALDATTISESTTWIIGPSVDADYADLHEALEAANDLRIHPDVTLFLQLEPGTHTYTETVVINHPDGANIYIDGNVEDPSSVVLAFSGTDAVSGFLLDMGNRLGGLRGMTLYGDGADTHYGIYVTRGSLAWIDDLVVNDWVTAGVHVAYGSVLFAGTDGLEADANGSFGALAQYGSVLVAPGMSANDNDYGALLTFGSAGSFQGSEFSNNDSAGVASHWGSVGDFQNVEANSNTYHGLNAQYGSQILGQGASADGNSSGFYSNALSFLWAYQTASTNNAVYGHEASYLSYIIASEPTALSGNGTDYSGLTSIDPTHGALIDR